MTSAAFNSIPKPAATIFLSVKYVFYGAKPSPVATSSPPPLPPPVPWDVEEHGLEEEGEADPLVVLVVLPTATVSGGRRHTRVSHVMANLSINLNIQPLKRSSNN